MDELYTQPQPPVRQSISSITKEIILFCLLALPIVIVVRMFIAQPFLVNGQSMSPTFESGQYLIIDQLSYHFNEPQRGDVVVFRYPNDTSKFFIKRIIGLPGETVKITDSHVTITNTENPQGFNLDEPYIHFTRTDSVESTLETDEYFVLGDNRFASSDSRVWGPLKKEYIVGRAYLRLLPFDQIGLLPGSVSK